VIVLGADDCAPAKIDIASNHTDTNLEKRGKELIVFLLAENASRGAWEKPAKATIPVRNQIWQVRLQANSDSATK
jgi:hypothetical protein